MSETRAPGPQLARNRSFGTPVKLMLRAAIVALAVLLAAGSGAEQDESRERSSAELVRMGDEAFSAGRYSAAVELYRSAVKRDEHNFTARMKLIGLLARLAGREDEARTEIDSALGMGNLGAVEIRSIGEICSANGFPDKAISAYKALLERDRGDLAALEKLIDVLLAGKEFDRAREQIEAYEKGSSCTVEGLGMIAERCSGRSQFDLARIAYEGVLKRDEKNLAALLGSGECLTRLGELAQAVRRLSSAAECHPERVEPLTRMGELLLRTGDYTGAEEVFGKALKLDPRSIGAAVGYACVLSTTGRYAEAVQALGEAVEVNPASPALLVALGRLLDYTGEDEAAQKRFEEALAVEPWYLDAIVGLGSSFRQTGKLDLARRQFLRLYDFWDARLGQLDAVSPGDMLNVAIACAFTDNPQDAIDVLEQLLKRDPTNTEALLWEARLFSERHQPGDAARELQKLLSINPNHPEGHAELAGIHIESGRYELAAESCERALKTNPNEVRALDLLSSIHLLDLDYGKAEETAKKALAVNPRSLSSLSSLASCYWQTGKKSDYEQVRSQVLKINPAYGEFYLTVARGCENKRRNEEAIAFLKEAIVLKPDCAPAYTRVAILLMREGEEEEAEGYLRKSYELDSYDPKTTNFINLLEHMKREFVSVQTEHFLFKWDRARGRVLASFFPEYAERMYGEVCREFGFEPKNPTLVEIFESHEEFSARIVGLPFIATIGASFGKTIAADSPKSAAFNWKDVLRHEFVHVVNLQQSKMQIPYWLTEGLATCHEESPLPVDWERFIVRMLYLGQIIPLDKLNSQFTRPKTTAHKQAAYAESNLMCRYLMEHHGLPTISRMIEMYGENLPTRDVIGNCLSMSEEEFEGKVEEYIFRAGRESRLPPLFLEGDGELIETAKKERPEDDLLNMAHGRLLLQEAVSARGSKGEAKLDAAAEVLRKIIEAKPDARGAYSTLAEIHLARGKYDEAKDAALKAVGLDGKDFAAYRCLGIACQQAGEEEEAIRALEQAAELYPRAVDVWYRLAELYSRRDDEERMVRALEGAAAADHKNVTTRKKLAGYYVSRKDHKKAIDALEKALEHNLYDGEAYRMMVDALEATGCWKTARRYAGIGADAAFITAQSLIPFQKERVLELLKLALGMCPEHEGASSLLKQIGE